MEVDLKNLTPDIRYLNDMREVIFDKEWLKTAENFELYYMYRKLKVENGLRYDVTVIPPRMFGKEFIKTKGHVHAGFYGEVYIVLEGEGIYFAQKLALRSLGEEGGDSIEDVFAVKAKKGDVIIIPAGYGHVTINPSLQELKTANWVAENDKGNFEPFVKNQGACYYYLASQSQTDADLTRTNADTLTQGTWIKNEHYKNVPPIRFEEPLKSVPENLDFLKAN